MPPVVRVTKTEILKKAFEVARRDGLEALTARRLAKELNCSTRPIYRAYGSMQELADEVVLMARQFGMDFIRNNGGFEHPIHDAEMGYVNLARRERHLFNILFMSGNVPDVEDNSNFVFDANEQIASMKKLDLFSGLKDTQLKRILMGKDAGGKGGPNRGNSFYYYQNEA